MLTKNRKLNLFSEITKHIWVCCGLVMLLLMSGISQAQTPGEVCEGPINITELPFAVTDNTSAYGDDYESGDRPDVAPGAIGTPSAFYLGGDDVVYAYTASSDGNIDITVSNHGSYTGFFVFTGCPFASTVGGHTLSSATTDLKVESLPVVSGETYYIVISTWPTPQSTNYTLSVKVAGTFDCSVLEANIGESCDDGDANTVNDTVNEDCECAGVPMAANDEACLATALACGGETLTQSLIGASSSLDDDCFGSGTSDVWFNFTTDGSQIVTVGEVSGFDAVVQLFTGDDCENLIEAGACKDGPENFTITEAGTYYFRVRPYYSSGDEGTISVNLTCVDYDCPAEQVNFGDACDDGDANTINDVVGEDCECAGIIPPDGIVCEAPIQVTSLPYLTTDNTENYGDDYSSGDRPDIAPGAIGSPSASYLGGDDVVYSYTPSSNQAVDISVTNHGS